MNLDVYTWDQAEIIRAWSPAAFAAIGIKPATIRQWAARGHINPVGQGPNGCKLYSYDAVVRHADRNITDSVAQPDQRCHTENADGSRVSTERRSA
jgi:hypothetical protein